MLLAQANLQAGKGKKTFMLLSTYPPPLGQFLLTQE
jgi:hypothetical protein